MSGFIDRTNPNLPLSIDKRVTTTSDAGDQYITETAYQKTDIVVDSTQKIAEKWVNDDGDIKYKELQLSLNAAGEVVKLEVLSYSNSIPAWASTLLT